MTKYMISISTYRENFFWAIVNRRPICAIVDGNL